jgi:sugar lactone lactonase YvrE/enterochelin esterase-like enzyme
MFPDLYRCLITVISVGALFCARGADEYPPHPDSVPQEGVPKGVVSRHTFNKSEIFPGTTRDYWIYVPAQYDPAKPACVFINQDGIQNNAPVVFDNLIHKGEMPVTIGVFVTPGVVKAVATNALDRFNRSFEYDGLGPAYAQFLLEELLPEVERQQTAGKPIVLSHRGNDRCLGGSSSGAICAFTAAWERPEEFSRVFSSIGTYVGLRGGHSYATLIRKFEPKPIRIFLQDGSSDLNIYAGDWWMANQTMERALVFAGYEVAHVWGEGGHNGKHAAAIFPDAMRFLWKDWPQPIAAGLSKNGYLLEILKPGANWEMLAEGIKGATGITADRQGEVFFNKAPDSKTLRIRSDGVVTEFLPAASPRDGQRFGPGNRLYVVDSGERQLIAYDAEGKSQVLAEGIRGKDLVVRSDGTIYVTEPAEDGNLPGRVWLVRPDGGKQVVDERFNFPGGITLCPDQSLLYVGDARAHWVFSYQIQADGSLANKQKYFHLHVPDTAEDSGAGGMGCDREGRLYVATRMGIQVCDQAGRVQCIIPTPNNLVTGLTFGGEKFDVLYAACGDRIFKRQLKVSGAPVAPPIKPAAPRL